MQADRETVGLRMLPYLIFQLIVAIFASNLLLN